MKKLPIGIQTFSELIEENYVYIDKTEYLYKLIMEPKYYFISRPRRFGKSLTVTTLKSLFKGKKDLFKNLWIYDKIEWQEYPVIHIDFNTINHSMGIDIFEKSLSEHLIDIGVDYGIALQKSSAKTLFKELVQKLSKLNKVVLLIDEYDKPIIDYMKDIKKANENKSYLSSFYEAIKGLDEYWKFVLLTGVSKFSKVSMFSKLNNLRDITISEHYSGLCGITEEELYETFDDEIKEIAVKDGITTEELKVKIRTWYDGYSWDGEVRVYNPFSILNYFADEKFNNYWFASGTPTFLIEQIKKNEYDMINIERIEASEYLLNSFDIERIDITTLMFQTGYLTIDKIEKEFDDSSTYILKAPNREVKISLVNYILAMFTNKEVPLVRTPYLKMMKMLRDEKIEGFMTILKSVYAGIPYNLYVDEEAYYHSLFYLMLAIMGAKIDVEVLTDKGRIDGVIEFENIVYVIEFKLGTSKDALKQIKSKRYYEKYLSRDKKVVLLGIGGFREKEIEYTLEKV